MGKEVRWIARVSPRTGFLAREPRRWGRPVARRIPPRAVVVVRVGGRRLGVVGWFVGVARCSKRAKPGGGCSCGFELVVGFGRSIVLFVGLGRCERPSSGRGCCRGRGRVACIAGSSRLTSGPILECRANRKCAREAVRLLVGERPRGGPDLGVAAVTTVRNRRALVSIVLEGDEGTGVGAVRDGQAAIAHRAMIAKATLPRPCGAQVCARRKGYDAATTLRVTAMRLSFRRQVGPRNN
jgi:hypothetical protein